jgi:hypothetical protein
MGATFEDDLRRALAAGAHAADVEPDLDAALARRRRRKRTMGRAAVLAAAVVVLLAGLVAWRSLDGPDATVTGPAGREASGVRVVLPDGHGFSVVAPTASAARPVVRTSAGVRLDGCCPDAVVSFEPTAVDGSDADDVAGDDAPGEWTGTTGRSPVPMEELGSWTTASGLRLSLRVLGPPGREPLVAGGMPDEIADFRQVVGQVGDHRMVVSGFSMAGMDVATARRATQDLEVTVGDGGYPVVALGSLRSADEPGPTPTPSPGVIVFEGVVPDAYGTSAIVDLGDGEPSLYLVRSDCTEDATTTVPADDDLGLAMATRCFPDAGVRATMAQRGPIAAGPDVADVIAQLRIEP